MSGRMPNGPRHRAGRAFVILEMMVAVAVFAIFSVVAMRTLSLYLHLSRDAAQAEHAHRTFDSALARLRADVWAARAVSVPASNSVSLDLGQGGGTVTWNANDEGALVRTASNEGTVATAAPEPQTWPTAGRGVTFRQAAAGVAMELPANRGTDGGAYRFASQLLLAKEGT